MTFLAALKGFLAAILVILLTPLLAFALLVFEIDATLLSSDFYKERLRNANAYDFLLNNVATSALQEARALPPPAGMTENPLNATGLSTERIVNALNRALPPGWLRKQTEYNLDQIVPFAAGDRDRFAARLDLSDRVPQIIEETGALVESADLHGMAFDMVVSPQLDTLHARVIESGLELERERLERAFLSVFTKEWTSQQVSAIYYETAPYLTGQTDSFEARVQLDGLQPALVGELGTFARELDLRTIVSQQAIDPMVRSGRGRSVRLIQGLDLPQSEVMAIFGDSITQAQYEAVADEVVAELASYMFGDTDTPTVAIDLTAMNRQAQPGLVALARQNVNDAVNRLPPCADGEAWQPPPSAFGNLAFPICSPADPQAKAALQQWLSDFDAGMDAHVESAIIARMPGRLTLTETNFWNAMNNGGANLSEEQVAQVRELLSGGVAFTSDDLKSALESELGPSAVQTLEDVRSFFQDGVEFSAADLVTPDPRGGMRMDSGIETARSQLAMLPAGGWVLSAGIAAILLVFAALMPNRRRIIWTAGCMTFISALVFAFFGPLYDLFLEPAVRSSFACDVSMFGALSSDFPATSFLLCRKMFQIGVESINAIANGAALKAFVIMAISALLTLAALIWRRYIDRRNPYEGYARRRIGERSILNPRGWRPPGRP